MVKDKNAMSRYLFTISLLLAAVFTAEIAKSQQSASAVMQVTAKIIPASSVELDEGSPFFLSGNTEDAINYGGFSLSLPEDVQIITSGLDHVEMANSDSSWKMNSKMDQTISGDGKVQFRFFTNPTREGVEGNLYKGIQVATIEYL